MADRQRPKSTRHSPYARELAVDDGGSSSKQEVALPQESPGLSGPLGRASLGASPAADGSRRLPRSRLSFNDPFAHAEPTDVPPAASTRHAQRRGLPPRAGPSDQSDSEDSSDDEGADGEASSAAAGEDEYEVMERADDTLQRLLREGVWSEPPPLARGLSGPHASQASQPLCASWRLPGQASSGGAPPVVLEPASQQLNLSLSLCAPPAAAAAAEASSLEPEEGAAAAEDETCVEPAPPRPRAAWQTPRRAPRPLPATGAVRTELRVFVGSAGGDDSLLLSTPV